MGNAISLGSVTDPLSLCQNLPSIEENIIAHTDNAMESILVSKSALGASSCSSTESGSVPGERSSRAVFAVHRAISFCDIYRKVRRLGKGSYGEVYLAEEIGVPGRLVAVKELDCRLSDGAKPSAIKCYSAEVSALSSLPPHPRIIRVFETFETDDGVCHIVMEPCRGGELYEHIVDRARHHQASDAVGLPEPEVSSLMRQVLEALAYLHSKDIVHRDVKAENFLFVDEHDKSRLKLCDFGAAVNLKTVAGGIAKGRIGTLSYAAPEIYQAMGADTRSDMWSAGVVLYVMLCSASPFRHSSDKSTKVAVYRIRTGNIIKNRAAWQGLSDAAVDLVTRLLVVDPSRRLTATEALEHPFILATAPPTPRMLKWSTIGKLERYLSLLPQQIELLRAAARLIPESQLGNYSRLFTVVDTDHDGLVTFNEIASLIEDRRDPRQPATSEPFPDYTEPLDYIDFIIAVESVVNSETIKVLSPAMNRSSRSCGCTMTAMAVEDLW
ncbi:hypothetical protein FOL47_003834 [Perkinsus chesapeaki]|uniref:Calmodulin n=1 Tax=Perkinsus chesapeaki TaxID=330153 RepID=A0A7J6M643_PERCH|nr:hypothetical protein FOL47_003834 [Perkinsus chesapeaki]